jgi:hypothetical protein
MWNVKVMINFCDHDVSKQSEYTGTIAVIKPKHVSIYNNAGFIYSFKLSLNLCSYRLTSHSYQIINGAATDLSIHRKAIGC